MGDLRIGPAGWNYKDWNGVFYPARRPRGFSELAYLAEYFDMAEINSSFYGPFSAQSAAKWIQEVSANSRFMFTGKLWQRFTHETGGNLEDEKAVRKGFDALQNAGKLGAILVQFPFSFHNTKDNAEILAKLFARFGEYPLVLEVRHASWDKPDVLEFLTEHNVGFCNIDQPIIGRSLKPTSYVTSSVGYVRFHGRRYDTWFSDDPKLPSSARYDYLYAKAEIEEWILRIGEIAEKMKYGYVVANNHVAAKSLHVGAMFAAAYYRIKRKVPDTMVERYPDLKEIASEPPRKTTLF
jgi:uncharacterized protein YecE (DUF72 family)